MYISIGADFSVRDRAVIGIFDLDNTSVSKHTRAFLAEAEAQGEVVDVSGKLPKSYVLTEEFGLRRVYLTQYNAPKRRPASLTAGEGAKVPARGAPSGRALRRGCDRRFVGHDDSACRSEQRRTVQTNGLVQSR